MSVHHGDSEVEQYLQMRETQGAKGVTLRDLLLVLQRRRRIFLGSLILSLLVTGSIILTRERHFQAEADIMIEPRKTEVARIDAVLSSLPRETAAIRTELDLIASPTAVARIVEAYDLAKDPEFNGTLRPPSALAKLIAQAKEMLSIPTEVKTLEPRQELAAIQREVRSRVNVWNEPQSYTISVSFTSTDPEKAARLANAFVDEYLGEQIRRKQEVTQYANNWLNTRVADLRRRVEEADIAVQELRQRENLFQGVRGETVLAQQLAELNKELALAGADRSRAEARAQAVRDAAKRGGVSANNLAEVLGSPLIQRLSEEEATARRHIADLRTRLGDKHPELKSAAAALADVQVKQREEIAKVIAVVNGEVDIAKAREAALSESVARITADALGKMGQGARVIHLEREAEASRRVYETLLARLVETSDQGGLLQPDARVASPAQAPLDPAPPSASAILGIGIGGGLAVGLFLAFLRDHLHRGFRSTRHVEQVTGIPAMGFVPALTRRRDRPEEYALIRPYSAYGEALRAIGVTLQCQTPARSRGRIVMVTSALPGEGKTTFCASFARMLAASGKRTLLLECDLRRPRLAKVFENTASADLGDVLTGRAPWNDALSIDERSGLHYIIGRPHSNHPQEMLASEAMQRVLGMAVEEYDVVILDTPPITAVADAGILIQAVDDCLMVVRWDRTPQEVVTRAMDRLGALGRTATGVVLTRVNLRQIAGIEDIEEGYSYARNVTYYRG